MKKTLHHLIQNTQWTKIEDFIQENYEGEDLQFHKQLYWKLYNMQPLKNESNIVMHLDVFSDEVSDIFGSSEDLYYEVESYNEIRDEEWELYIGFYIAEDVLKKHAPEEIICHMLFELLYGEIEFLMD